MSAVPGPQAPWPSQNRNPSVVTLLGDRVSRGASAETRGGCVIVVVRALWQLMGRCAQAPADPGAPSPACFLSLCNGVNGCPRGCSRVKSQTPGPLSPQEAPGCCKGQCMHERPVLDWDGGRLGGKSSSSGPCPHMPKGSWEDDGHSSLCLVPRDDPGPTRAALWLWLLCPPHFFRSCQLSWGFILPLPSPSGPPTACSSFSLVCAWQGPRSR